MDRAFVGAALFIALSARGVAQAPTQAQPSVTVPAGNAERGKALYQKTGCYQCHSNEAQGGTAGPRLGPNPIPFARFVAYVRAPRGEMPPYTAKVMSEQELADVYGFLQARPRPPALASIPLLAK
jgi:ubiquinol-cytochrome c reductase cytochrome c subunit